MNIYVNSTALDGLRANDGIIVDGGVVNVETTGNGAKGVRSGGVMKVNGGRMIAIADGDTRIETDETGLVDTTACAALYCDTLVTVNAGILKFKATGDGGKGLNAKHNVVINGGKFMSVAMGTNKLKKAKGMKIDGNLAINGGYTYSYSRQSDPLDVAGNTSVTPGYTTYKLTVKVLTISY